MTVNQLVALEKAKLDKEAHGEFDSEHLGYCVAQDTFYVGTLKGVGRVYQQTVIDTYSKVGFAKLYTRKTPLTAADILELLPVWWTPRLGCFTGLGDGNGATTVRSGVQVRGDPAGQGRGVSVVQASRDLDVGENVLRRWIKEFGVPSRDVWK